MRPPWQPSIIAANHEVSTRDLRLIMQVVRFTRTPKAIYCFLHTSADGQRLTERARFPPVGMSPVERRLPGTQRSNTKLRLIYTWKHLLRTMLSCLRIQVLSSSPPIHSHYLQRLSYAAPTPSTSSFPPRSSGHAHLRQLRLSWQPWTVDPSLRAAHPSF